MPFGLERGDQPVEFRTAGHVGERAPPPQLRCKVNGQAQTGTHYGVAEVGVPVKFDHNFGENRAVKFRTCISEAWFDDCDEWQTGYA